MIEVEQFGSQGLRKQIRNVSGVKAFCKDGTWYFGFNETTVDWPQLKPLLPDALYEQIKKPTVQIMPLAEKLFYDISRKAKFEQNQYEIEGDIISQMDPPKMLNVRLYTMIDNHDMKHFLKVRADKRIPLQAALLNHRVRIQGQIELYRPYAIFELVINQITDLGPCSRLRQLSAWREEQQKLLATAKPSALFPFSNIGLIVASGSHEYSEFMKTLRPAIAKTVFFRELILDADTLKRTIDDFSGGDASCVADCICILALGRHPEELIPLSSPAVLEAMSEALGPVLFCIPHEESDPILSEAFATKLFDSPVALAKIINQQYEIKALSALQQKYSAPAAHMNWQEECQRLAEENLKLQLTVNELTEKLESKRSGFWSFFHK